VAGSSREVVVVVVVGMEVVLVQLLVVVVVRGPSAVMLCWTSSRIAIVTRAYM
jgi:hypothetical protein